MGRALVFPAMFFLSSLCLIQAASLQFQARQSVEVQRNLILGEWGPTSVPSLASPLQASTFPQQSSTTTVPPANVYTTIVTTTGPPRSTIDGQEILGYVGVESDLFHRKCKKRCEMQSKRKCRLVANPTIHPHCKKKPFLGHKSTPTSCFFLHCKRLYRPKL